jgi:hypothetical protein
VFELLVAGELPARAVVLLSMIDALTDPKGRGCYASNQYLGDALGISDRNTKVLIRILIEKGLVLRTGATSDRELRVSWSKAGDGNCPTSRKDVSARAARDPSSGQLGMPSIPSARDAGHPHKYYLSENTSKTQCARRNGVRTVRVPELTGGGGGGGAGASAGLGLEPSTEYPVSANGARADRLKDIVNGSSRPLLGKYSRALGERYVTRLVNAVGVDRVDDALDWYAQHVNDKYVPAIRCGRDLYEKWDKLDAAISRNVSPSGPGPAVELSDDGRDIVRQLRDRTTWRNRIPTDLDQAVERSLRSVTDLKDRLRPHVPKKVGNWNTIGSEWDRSLHRQLTENFLGPADSFVTRWFRELAGWVRADAMIPTFVVGLDNPRFHEEGRRFAGREFGDPKLWDRIIKEIGSAKDSKAGRAPSCHTDHSNH